jgi:hypothetical protein
MVRLVPNAKKLVAGVVAAGALSVALAGMVEAAPAGAAPALLASPPKVGAHFKCARATKVLARIEYTEGQISSGFPTLTHRAAKAKAHGNTKRADRLQKRLSRLESPQLTERLATAAKAIENKCHVSAPSPS